MSIYRVRGSYHFRGHAPGTTFEASLEPDEERRAVRRGNIEILFSQRITLDESKIRRPKG